MFMHKTLLSALLLSVFSFSMERKKMQSFYSTFQKCRPESGKWEPAVMRSKMER